MLELKTLKRPMWSAWDVKGNLSVVVMGKRLWLFKFDNKKEADRILKLGSRKMGNFSIFLKKWSEDVGCNNGREGHEEAWVRLLGLPVHLWSRSILRNIGDSLEVFWPWMKIWRLCLNFVRLESG